MHFLQLGSPSHSHQRGVVLTACRSNCFESSNYGRHGCHSSGDLYVVISYDDLESRDYPNGSRSGTDHNHRRCSSVKRHCGANIGTIGQVLSHNWDDDSGTISAEHNHLPVYLRWLDQFPNGPHDLHWMGCNVQLKRRGYCHNAGHIRRY